KGAQATVHHATVELTVAVAVQSPDAFTGAVDTDPVRAETDPVADHWAVASLAKGTEAQIYGAVVPVVVAITVQLPQPRARLEDPDLDRPRAGPVANHRQVALLAKGSQTGIHRASVQHPVAVQVQVPSASTGAENPDLHVHLLGEGGNDRRVSGEGHSAATSGAVLVAPAGEGSWWFRFSILP